MPHDQGSKWRFNAVVLLLRSFGTSARTDFRLNPGCAVGAARGPSPSQSPAEVFRHVAPLKPGGSPTDALADL